MEDCSGSLDMHLIVTLVYMGLLNFEATCVSLNLDCIVPLDGLPMPKSRFRTRTSC